MRIFTKKSEIFLGIFEWKYLKLRQYKLTVSTGFKWFYKKLDRVVLGESFQEHNHTHTKLC